MASLADGNSGVKSQESLTSHRRPDIQGLRAIAVLAVIAFHAGLPVPGGFAGVDVFFVISGFVITGMLHREYSLTQRVRFRRFYARRFRRLTPALALTVSVTIAFSVLVISPLGPMQTGAETGIGAMLLAANFVIARTTGGYFDAPAALNPLLNTWSLSVEEQFYLVFPLVLLVGWALARRFRHLSSAALIVVMTVSAISLALAMITSRGGIVPHFPSVFSGFYSTVLRAWEFGLGALLALFLSRVRRIPIRMASILGILGGLGLLVSFFMLHESPAYPGIPTLLPTCATVFLLMAGAAPRALTSRALSTRPMVAIGDTSYSLYLWHWPFIVFAALLWPNRAWILIVAALASVLPALVSYRWVETPVRQLRGVSARRMLTIVVATLIAPITICALVLFAAQQGFWNPAVRDFQSALSPHEGELHGCITKLPVDQRDLGACTWNSAARGRPIYLVGDSNAEHFSEAAISAANSSGRPVTILTSPSCPLIDVHFAGSDESEFAWCRDYFRTALAWLLAQRPGTVIWAAADEYWWDSSISVGLSPAGTTAEAPLKSAYLRAGLESVIAPLRAHGDSVVMIPSVPHFRYPEPLWDSSYCSLPAIVNHRCSRDLPRDLIQERQFGARADISAVTHSTSSLSLELNDFFCSAASCSTTRHGQTLFRDWSHISAPMSQSLGPLLELAVQRADSRAAAGS